jgi:hypothetical protein
MTDDQHAFQPKVGDVGLYYCAMDPRPFASIVTEVEDWPPPHAPMVAVVYFKRPCRGDLGGGFGSPAGFVEFSSAVAARLEPEPPSLHRRCWVPR